MVVVVIGLVLFAIGIFAICIWWGSKSKNVSTLGAGILLTLGGLLIGFGVADGSPEKVAIGFICSIIGTVLIMVQLFATIKRHQEKTAQISVNNKIDFYNECISNGVKECQNEKEIQKITLIAQKRNLKFTDISKLFNDAKIAMINEIKNKEKLECAELERYSQYSGRDKRIAILSDEKKQALNNAETLRVGASAILNASQQKEHNWAVWGGLADGIAGHAAGVATALDVQAQNAQIRAQNEENLKAFAPLVMTSYNGAEKNEQKAKRLQEEIDATKLKLVLNDSVNDCFIHMNFTNTKVTVSETGTCIVTTNAKLSTPMIIYNDVDAIIDGTILAKIYEGNNFVGTASLVLPKYGIGKNDVELKGMSLFSGHKGKNYRVEFAASNLWAMER